MSNLNIILPYFYPDVGAGNIFERCYFLLFKLVLRRVNVGVLGARGTGWSFQVPGLNKGILLGFIFYVNILPEWQQAVTKRIL